MSTTTAAPGFSFVLEYPPAAPAEARRHFLARLAVETDPADLKVDLERGNDRIVVVDARSTDAWERCRIPGSRSLPHRSISPAAVADIPRDKVVVVYCYGPGCNAATKAAEKLAGLGYQVKELMGGIEYWRHERHPVEGTEGASASLYE